MVLWRALLADTAQRMAPEARAGTGISAASLLLEFVNKNSNITYQF